MEKEERIRALRYKYKVAHTDCLDEECEEPGAQAKASLVNCEGTRWIVNLVLEVECKSPN